MIKLYLKLKRDNYKIQTNSCTSQNEGQGYKQGEVYGGVLNACYVLFLDRGRGYCLQNNSLNYL